ELANAATAKGGIALIVGPVANGLAAGQRLGERDLSDQRAEAAMAIVEDLLFGKQRAQLGDRGIDEEREGEKGRHGQRGKAQQDEHEDFRAQAFRDSAPFEHSGLAPQEVARQWASPACQLCWGNLNTSLIPQPDLTRCDRYPARKSRLASNSSLRNSWPPSCQSSCMAAPLAAK